MQYAFVNEIKQEATKGGRGICMGCGKEVIAKCGKIKMHHWAHKSFKHCDSWWESETEWHREWKNKFPIEFREITFFDGKNNEFHRADIHTSMGVTIEFQNSPITSEELRARDAFYSKLIWVVNGIKFKNRFHLTRQIPNPLNPLLYEFEFSGMVYFKKTDILNSKLGDLLLVYGSNHNELENVQISDVHFEFSWKNTHSHWFDSGSPIFIDMGDNFLYWLRKREQIKESFWYVQLVKKSEFISKYSIK